MTFLKVMHRLGAYTGFGIIVVYCWITVILSYITLGRLSSSLVCWLRVVFVSIATILLFGHIFVEVFYLLSRYIWRQKACNLFAESIK